MRLLQKCCKLLAGLNSIIAFCLFYCCLLTYSLSINSAFSVVDCETVQLNQASGSPDTISVWRPDTSVLCHENQHTTAYLLAYIILALVAPGLPLSILLFSLCVLRIHARERLIFGLRSVRHGQKSKRQKTSQLFKAFRRLPNQAHSDIQARRAWLPIFGFGQPWLRPFVLAMVPIVSLVSFVLPLQQFPTARGIILITILLGAALLVGWPRLKVDHEWATWKKIPRTAVYLTSAALVLLQTFLQYDVNASLSDQTTGDLTVSTVPLCTRTTVVLWLVVVSTFFLPILLTGSLLVWFFRLVPCSLFCRACCPRCCQRSLTLKQSQRLVGFFRDQPTEDNTRSLLALYGFLQVSAAVASDDPYSALSGLAVPRRKVRDTHYRNSILQDMLASDNMKVNPLSRKSAAGGPEQHRRASIKTTNPIFLLHGLRSQLHSVNEVEGTTQNRLRPGTRFDVLDVDADALHRRLVKKPTSSLVASRLHMYTASLAKGFQKQVVLKRRRRSKTARRFSQRGSTIPSERVEAEPTAGVETPFVPGLEGADLELSVDAEGSVGNEGRYSADEAYEVQEDQ